MTPGQLGLVAPLRMCGKVNTLFPSAHVARSTHPASPVVDTHATKLSYADGLGQAGGVFGGPHLTLLPASSQGREAEGELVYHFCSRQW